MEYRAVGDWADQFLSMSRVRTKAKAEDDELVNLNARVARSLIRRVRSHCAHSEVTMRHFITSALEQHLTSKKRRP